MNAFIDGIAQFLSTRVAAVRGMFTRLAARPVPLWKSVCCLILGLLAGGLLGRLL